KPKHLIVLDRGERRQVILKKGLTTPVGMGLPRRSGDARNGDRHAESLLARRPAHIIATNKETGKVVWESFAWPAWTPQSGVRASDALPRVGRGGTRVCRRPP